MPDDFLIARNPEPDSKLPFLIRLPMGRDGVILKAREPWPRTTKVYCHPGDWPADVEVLERVPVRACTRRGGAIDLVLARARENRSQFVFTRARGREVIFWQTGRTAKMARPAAAVPSARASGLATMEILVDVHERYAWTFKDAQVSTRKEALRAGDYAVRADDEIVAVVERKSLQDLVATLTSGKMRFVLADLSAVGHAAVVVEDRYAAVFKLERVRPAVVADGLAECQARFPAVPIVFADTRPLAQQWTYRFFGAVLAEREQEQAGGARLRALPGGGALPGAVALPGGMAFSGGAELSPGEAVLNAALEPTTAQVRAWARAVGLDVPARGRLAPAVWEAYRRDH